jgi:SWI/SNF related-matrix-associated actin-dependent regulator of chromatin subfamily C
MALDTFLKSENAIISCKSCQGECSSTLNSTAYYHNPAMKINLCSACFTTGKYSSEMASIDFIKIDPSSFPSSGSSSSSDWTEEELLKLLEAIEKYSDSGVNMAANNVWDAIAESVGKPREACLLQFLKLPTGEQLQQLYPSDSSVLSSISSSSFLNFPFSQSENPVLSVLAFLAGHVHPRVAAVASQAALSELSKLEGQENVDMQAVAATSLACASVHAQNLAAVESNRIAYWRDLLIETQLKKLQLKIESLEELEKVVEEERKEIEKQRLQIFMERFHLRKMLLQAEQKSSNVLMN